MGEIDGDRGRNTMNTKGKTTQIVTKFSFNKNKLSLLQIVSFYRVEIVKKPGRRGASGERTVRRLHPFASRILPLCPTWSSLGGVTQKRLRDPVRFHGSYDSQ